MLKNIIPLINSTKSRLHSGIHQLVKVSESEKQEFFLDKENCIEVDKNDVQIGKISKRNCHKVDENGDIKLHRAFSVFLFNKMGEMLIQKRSGHKVRRNVNKDFYDVTATI